MIWLCEHLNVADCTKIHDNCVVMKKGAKNWWEYKPPSSCLFWFSYKKFFCPVIIGIPIYLCTLSTSSLRSMYSMECHDAKYLVALIHSPRKKNIFLGSFVISCDAWHALPPTTPSLSVSSTLSEKSVIQCSPRHWLHILSNKKWILRSSRTKLSKSDEAKKREKIVFHFYLGPLFFIFEENSSRLPFGKSQYNVYNAYNTYQEFFQKTYIVVVTLLLFDVHNVHKAILCNSSSEVTRTPKKEKQS